MNPILETIIFMANFARILFITAKIGMRSKSVSKLMWQYLLNVVIASISHTTAHLPESRSKTTRALRLHERLKSINLKKSYILSFTWSHLCPFFKYWSVNHSHDTAHHLHILLFREASNYRLNLSIVGTKWRKNGQLLDSPEKSAW